MNFPKEVQEILDDVIDSLVKWDLVIYLHSNPTGRTSIEEMASSIGRSVSEVEEALSGLSESKVVQYEDDGEAIYYRFNPGKRWDKHMSKFFEGLADRNTRWLILNYLIEKHGFKQSG